MDNEEQWERSLAAGKSKFRKLTIVIAVADPCVERRWVPVQDVPQGSEPPFLRDIFIQTCRLRFRRVHFLAWFPAPSLYPTGSAFRKPKKDESVKRAALLV